HRRAFACDYARREAVPARAITSREAVTRYEREAGAAMACAAALAVRDPGHSARSLLHPERGRAEGLGVCLAAIVQIEIGERPLEQQLARREAGIGVLGGLARHRDAAFDQPCQ